MASGDRIELLTAGTFETAMSTVAKETTAQTISTNVNTANTNINTIKSTVSTINTNTSTIQTSVGSASMAPSVTSTGGVVNTANTVQQKLQGISQYQIGATNSTGGTATAGNVMAKLNTLINNVNTIQSNIGDNSLNSTVFIPSDNVLKTIVNTPVNLTSSNKLVLGYFIAKYSGVLRVKINAKSTTEAGTCMINAYYNPKSATPTLYPTMPSNIQLSGISTEKGSQVTINSLTSISYILDLYVASGDIIYFVPSISMSNATLTCNSMTICGTTVSTY